MSKKIFLICGSDEFAVKTKSHSIIESLCGKDFEQNPALEIIHGDTEEKMSPSRLLAQIIEAIFTPPFLSEKKVVWAKNFQFEFITGKAQKSKSKKEDEKEGIFEDFLNVLKAELPENIQLVLTIFNVDKRSVLYKTCSKKAELFEFEKIGVDTKNIDGIISQYIREKSSELGIKITKEAEDFICEACGANYSRVNSELEKIAAYISPREEANLVDCLQICSMTPELASWAFTEAIGKRDVKAAIKSLDILLTPKNPENRMLYSIISLFTDISHIKIAEKVLKLENCLRFPEFDYKLKNINGTLKEKFSWLNIFSMNSYRAFKLLEQSRNFSECEIANAFKQILETNKSLVSGTPNPRIELENLAITLCKKNK
ncbi:MAG TPA: hypothetical protein P5270_00535 [Victivallales bacterium]|nr:hypothetical protein [Victivallales bacterium]HPO90653.1 hypothetical protein [Victivallales bacterium]HRR27827.1 hypothetical protein [Victivallales bacterium]HRU00674.1 hypothetical protein [Victivallales bacterium]